MSDEKPDAVTDLDEHEGAAGEVMKDPWDDDEQTDWPTESVDPGDED